MIGNSVRATVVFRMIYRTDCKTYVSELIHGTYSLKAASEERELAIERETY